MRQPTRHSLLWVLSIGCVLIFWAASSRSRWQIIPDSAGSSLTVLRNAPASISAPEMASLPAASWVSWNGRDLLQGAPSEVIWVRVTLHNPTPKALNGVIADSEVYADLVEFFSPNELDEHGQWRHLVAGERIPPQEKPFWGREAAFPLAVAPEASRTIYLRFSDHFGILSRVVWWPEQAAFFSARAHTTFCEAIYLGGLLVLLFSNLVLWTRVRFADTGHYLLYLCSLGGFMVVSRNQLPALGWAMGSPALETLTMGFIALAAVFLVNFARNLLSLPTIAPSWDSAVRVFRSGMLALALSALIVPWTQDRTLVNLTILGAASAHLWLWCVAFVLWRRGVPLAIYLVAAFGAFLLGLLPSLGVLWRVAPLEDTSPAGLAMLVGSALELLLFSMAATERYARMEQEKLAAQKSLLAEALQRQTLEEAYAEELAFEVRERTRELQSADKNKNQMIAVLGHDLRSPLAGLTQRAEQLSEIFSPESLYKFVVETAQIGRQLLLLIEDLVLWSRLPPGTSSARLHSVAAVIAPAAALHRWQSESRGLELVVDADPEIRVSTDLVLAQTLVRNLLANGSKVARYRVRVSAHLGPNGVRLAVEDDGPGLPPDIIAWLGTGTGGPAHGGLGLRLCLEICQRLGTRLEASTLPVAGTQIAFTLNPRDPEVLS